MKGKVFFQTPAAQSYPVLVEVLYPVLYDDTPPPPPPPPYIYINNRIKIKKKDQNNYTETLFVYKSLEYKRPSCA